MKYLHKKLIILSAILLIIPTFIFVLKQVSTKPTSAEIIQKKYTQAQEQANVLSATVAKQTAVPQDETPNVATITDVTKLQNQSFFKLAKNGDKILIYEKKKIIVLYRPNEDKVIASAPVLYNQDSINSSSSSAVPNAASNSASLPN